MHSNKYKHAWYWFRNFAIFENFEKQQLFLNGWRKQNGRLKSVNKNKNTSHVFHSALENWLFWWFKNSIYCMICRRVKYSRFINPTLAEARGNVLIYFQQVKCNLWKFNELFSTVRDAPFDIRGRLWSWGRDQKKIVTPPAILFFFSPTWWDYFFIFFTTLIRHFFFIMTMKSSVPKQLTDHITCSPFIYVIK